MDHQEVITDSDDPLWVKDEAEVVNEEEAVIWFAENLNVDINHPLKMDVGETEVTELPTTGSNQQENTVVDNSQVSSAKPQSIKLRGKDRLVAKRAILLTRSGRQVKPTSKILTFENVALEEKREKISTELERLKKVAAQYCPEEYKKYKNQCSKTLSHEATPREEQNICKTSMITTNEQTQPSSDGLHIYIQSRENCSDERNPSIETQRKASGNDLREENVEMQENVNTNNHCDRQQEDQNLQKILASLQTLEEQKKLIIEQNNIIINKNAQILALFKRKPVNDLTTLFEPLVGFPLTTIEEFNKFSEENNSDLLQKIHMYLLNHGGVKLRDFLNFALKALMADQLVTKFSWLGCAKTKRQSFGDTKLSNLIYMSAKRCSNFTGPSNKAEYKTEMLEVIRTTKQRYRNGIKKTNEELIAKRARLEDDIITLADDASLDATDIDL